MKSSSNPGLLVITTTNSLALARKISRSLLTRHLAASVQIHGPIRSDYWWKGKLRRAIEWSCEIRTSARLYPSVEKKILSIHSYELPEIIAVKVSKGLPAYLRWIRDNTKP